MNQNILQQSAVEVTTSKAYIFGSADARHGACCLPELYFSHPADKLEYVQGFEIVAGETLLSRQVKQLCGQVASVASTVASTASLIPA